MFCCHLCWIFYVFYVKLEKFKQLNSKCTHRKQISQRRCISLTPPQFFENQEASEQKSFLFKDFLHQKQKQLHCFTSCSAMFDDPEFVCFFRFLDVINEVILRANRHFIILLSRFYYKVTPELYRLLCFMFLSLCDRKVIHTISI